VGSQRERERFRFRASELVESDTVKLQMSILREQEFPDNSEEVYETSSQRDTQKLSIKRDFSFFDSKRQTAQSQLQLKSDTVNDTIARIPQVVQ